VFCVAGSNGKTTTKELLAALLETTFPTLRSQASCNNDVGVPLSRLELDGSHRAAVLEAGTNHPGELAPLVRLIVPRYGVVPQIGREHLEHFGDIDGVIAEESALGEGLPADGVLFLNGDCDAARPLASRTQARVVRTGFDAGNNWRARILDNGWNSTRFEVTAPEPEWCGVFEIAVPGRHMVSNALFYSGKALDVRYRAPFGVMILIILGFVLVSSDPPVALFGLFVAYALSGYVFWLWQKIFLRKKIASDKLSNN
jgi:UDP-N-acetylmuramyl pentapeptide synthase